MVDSYAQIVLKKGYFQARPANVFYRFFILDKTLGGQTGNHGRGEEGIGPGEGPESGLAVMQGLYQSAIGIFI